MLSLTLPAELPGFVSFAREHEARRRAPPNSAAPRDLDTPFTRHPPAPRSRPYARWWLPLPAASARPDGRRAPAPPQVSVWLYVLVGAALAFAFNMAAFLLVQTTSSLTAAMLGNVKIVLIIVLSEVGAALLGRSRLNIFNVLGYTVTILAGMLRDCRPSALALLASQTDHQNRARPRPRPHALAPTPSPPRPRPRPRAAAPSHYTAWCP